MTQPSPNSSAIERAQRFCGTYELRIPILMAPMAGACPPALAAAVANAGGMGACGALLMNADGIDSWVSKLRATSNGAFQLNTWIPDPEPSIDPDHEHSLKAFLSQWGPDVADFETHMAMPSFDDQCAAMLAASPRVISSIMGLYPPAMVDAMKADGIHWFATATTVAEALEAEAAGADVIVAQGMEAGGHRGAFEAGNAQTSLVGLFSLLPAVVDAVSVPVVATGGIGDARAVAAAMTLGASAVQVGTGLLRSSDANTPQVLADAMAKAKPEDTVATRAFSGRLGRSLRTDYTDAADAATSPEPAPYPIQRNLTSAMRKQAIETQSLASMQSWAGQSSAYARSAPAADIVVDLWADAQTLLPG